MKRELSLATLILSVLLFVVGAILFTVRDVAAVPGAGCKTQFGRTVDCPAPVLTRREQT